MAYITPSPDIRRPRLRIRCTKLLTTRRSIMSSICNTSYLAYDRNMGEEIGETPTRHSFERGVHMKISCGFPFQTNIPILSHGSIVHLISERERTNNTTHQQTSARNDKGMTVQRRTQLVYSNSALSSECTSVATQDWYSHLVRIQCTVKPVSVTIMSLWLSCRLY